MIYYNNHITQINEDRNKQINKKWLQFYDLHDIKTNKDSITDSGHVCEFEDTEEDKGVISNYNENEDIGHDSEYVKHNSTINPSNSNPHQHPNKPQTTTNDDDII